MTPAVLLDTCAAIWSLDPDKRFRKAEAEVERMVAAGRTVLVSPITAWEVGQLVSRGRLALPLDPKRWFATLLANGPSLAPLTSDILIDASFLPQSPLRDPGDRIIAATARHLGCPVMTRDRALLDYADAGWMQALAC